MELPANTPGRSNVASMLLQLKRDDSNSSSAENSKLELSKEEVNPNKDSSNSSSEPIVCNCRKSRCLKLYCQCFTARVVCNSACNCNSCSNTEDKLAEREAAVKMILERNPNAFDSKFKVQQSSTDETVTHKLGCRCRKSACLKKYCECFQAGVPCSAICTCLACANDGTGQSSVGSVASKKSFDGGLKTNRKVSPDGAVAIKRAAEVLIRAKGEGSEPSLSRSSSIGSNDDGFVPSAGPTNKRKRQWIELADYQQQQQPFAAIPSPSAPPAYSSLQAMYAGGSNDPFDFPNAPPLRSHTPPIDRPSILSRLSHSSGSSGGSSSKKSPPSGGSGGKEHKGLLLADPSLSVSYATTTGFPLPPGGVGIGIGGVRKPLSIRTASPNTLYIASALSLLCGKELSPKSLGADSPKHSGAKSSPSDVVAADKSREELRQRSQSNASTDNTSEEDRSESPFKLNSHHSLHADDDHDNEPLQASKSDISCLFPNSIPASTGASSSPASSLTQQTSGNSPLPNWTKPVVDVMYAIGSGASPAATKGKSPGATSSKDCDMMLTDSSSARSLQVNY